MYFQKQLKKSYPHVTESLSGTLLLLPGTRADYSRSFALRRRLMSAWWCSWSTIPVRLQDFEACSQNCGLCDYLRDPSLKLRSIKTRTLCGKYSFFQFAAGLIMLTMNLHILIYIILTYSCHAANLCTLPQNHVQLLYWYIKTITHIVSIVCNFTLFVCVDHFVFICF